VFSYVRECTQLYGILAETPNCHPAWNQQLTYQQCIERQVEHMARCIAGRDETYQPLQIE
jgi:hypothetical protein